MGTRLSFCSRPLLLSPKTRFGVQLLPRTSQALILTMMICAYPETRRVHPNTNSVLAMIYEVSEILGQ